MPQILVADDLYCPACGRTFKTPGGTRSHLSQSVHCAWYRKGKNPEGRRRTRRTPSPGPPEPDIEVPTAIPDVPVAEVIQDWDDDIFHFIPLDPDEPGPSSAPRSFRHLSDEDDRRVVDSHPTAGKVIRMNDNLHAKWKRSFGLAIDPDGDIEMAGSDSPNGFAPFASELDWRIADWVIKEGPGHKAFDRLLDIPGVQEKLGLSYSNIRGLHKIVDSIPERAGEWTTKSLSFPDRPGEKYLIRYRDPLAAIRTLLGNPAYAKDIVYIPKKVLSDSDRNNRVYNEMWTGKWWTGVQTKLPLGATLAPVIIATDKTQLTQFSGGKSAYPVYLTLGNIPKALRRKPSQNDCILLGYLSVDKIPCKNLSKQGVKSRNQKLFHASMRLILQPLISAGNNGMDVEGGDGKTRRVYPILASYVADYPEQCLVGCSKYGTCPKCLRSAGDLQEPLPGDPRTPGWTLRIIKEAEKTGTEKRFHDYCMEHEVAGVHQPFWTGFPLTNIALSLTPDVLHQLYQGVFKHLLGWCQSLMTEVELDARIRSLPSSFGVRHFDKGISSLSQVSGKERKAMARILLGCLVGKMPVKGIRACRSILDFIYLSQYSTHDDGTLDSLRNSLKVWNENREFFISATVRDDFNIPKFHSLLHYVECIEYFRTTDNYNTEMFERLHIDFAKHGWRASNRRDEFPQMITWLGRQEKISSFAAYQAWLEASRTPPQPPVVRTFTGQAIQLAKRPQSPRQPLADIELHHNTDSFIYTLKEFLNNIIPASTRLPVSRLRDATLPFTRLDVYHNFKFEPSALDPGAEPDNNNPETFQTVISRPQSADFASTPRFDTVIARRDPIAEATGLSGTRIGRVRVLFQLPTKLDDNTPAPANWPKACLAYVEWFSTFKPQHEDNHDMYMISTIPPRSNGIRHGAIIPLTDIRQTCQLFPKFGRDDVDPSWTTDTVLEHCTSFYVNNWASLYAYQSIW
ncbi:hypothetical protein MVEN_00678500 [Mycena venus]|uniref:C2H2-type domain-containing protein n=1 Tax=Mycena venus TaxID=2733690 RepID=A0A8H6YQE2_9AGAR|nr:hypothetical protein MVEN_00678500 [Mycena venus]